MIVIALLSCSFIYLTFNIILVLSRNKRAHKFFQTKSPDLPVLPNPSIWHGHMLQTTRPDKNWKIIHDHHEKYGPTYGFYFINQPWIATKDIDLLRLIEVEKAHKHINRAKFGLPFTEFNNSIFQVDDDDWRRVRRAISPALTNHKIRSDEVSSDIKSIVERLADSLDRKMKLAQEETGSKSFIVDVYETFQRFALAVIFLTTYKRDNIIDFDAKHDHWTSCMEAGARNISNPLVSIAIMFPFLRPFCRFLTQFHSVGRIQIKIIDYVIEASDINRVAREVHQKIQRKMSLTEGYKERQFDELKSQGNYKRRLVDTIIDAFIETKITYDDFIGSTLFLLLAGFETTADTITCLVWQLALHQDIQNKLRKTILEEGIDADYVLWCIMETVRYHPPVLLGTGRIITEDIDINGYRLPKGAFIMPSTYSIHHDPSIWPDCDEFKPERWHDMASFHPAQFMGFGLGPRNCVGAKLAIHEIKLVTQMLLTRFKIEECDETAKEYKFSSPGLVYTLLDQPIKVRFVGLE